MMNEIKRNRYYHQSGVKMFLTVVFLSSLCLIALKFSESSPNTTLLGKDFEMPLADVEGIAVDSSGNVYCGVNNYSRIQVYDKNGVFLRNVFLDISGGNFRFRISDDDMLHVAIMRGDIYCLFDTDGKLIIKRSKVTPRPYIEMGSSNDWMAYDSSGNVYRIEKIAWLIPRVVKSDTTGNAIVLIQQPLWRWALGFPIPAIPIEFISFVLLIKYCERIKRSTPVLSQNAEPG